MQHFQTNFALCIEYQKSIIPLLTSTKPSIEDFQLNIEQQICGFISSYNIVRLILMHDSACMHSFAGSNGRECRNGVLN